VEFRAYSLNLSGATHDGNGDLVRLGRMKREQEDKREGERKENREPQDGSNVAC
jgi:hypothetical protein